MKYFIAVGALVGLALACSPQEQGTASNAANPRNESDPAAVTPPPSGVTITAPANGDSTGADVTVTLSAMGVTIEKADAKHTEGHGHHHLFLDVAPPADTLVVPPGSANVVHLGTGDSTHTFKGLARGPHRVIALIAFGDHMPMTTVVRDTVNFVVK